MPFFTERVNLTFSYSNVLRTLIARIVPGTRRSEHITRVQSSVNRQARLPVVTVAPVRQLRSSDRKNRLYLNSHRTTFASRAFRNAAPVVWNNLPHHLTDDLSSPASVRCNLKTHIFSKSFRHWLPWPVCNCDSSIYFWLTCCVTNCLIIIIIIIIIIIYWATWLFWVHHKCACCSLSPCVLPTFHLVMLGRMASAMFHAGSWRMRCYSTLTRWKQFCKELVHSG